MKLTHEDNSIQLSPLRTISNAILEDRNRIEAHIASIESARERLNVEVFKKETLKGIDIAEEHTILSMGSVPRAGLLFSSDGKSFYEDLKEKLNKETLTEQEIKDYYEKQRQDLLNNIEARYKAIKEDTETYYKNLLKYYDEHYTIKPPETFAIPSNPAMFALIAMFAGKPQRIPRKLLEKPRREWTKKEESEAEKIINEIIEKNERPDYRNGQQHTRTTRTAIISDNERVTATAGITNNLFSGNIEYQETSLAINIKKTCGVEGMRHFLGLIIGLDENYRKGTFLFTMNEHLARLGYRKKSAGAYDTDLKKNATKIIKLFTSLVITAQRKQGKREKISAQKLFSLDGYEQELYNKEIIDETLTIRATPFWYESAQRDTENPQYTKLLKKIVTENHREHPLTIYLAPLFAIFWRMQAAKKQAERKLSVKNLMEWCDLDITSQYKMRKIQDLQSELDYMKRKGYLGEWENDGENRLPSQCKNPLNCVLTLSPPEWLVTQNEEIASKRERYLPSPRDIPTITGADIKAIRQKAGLSQKNLANHIGKTKQALSRVENGHISVPKTWIPKIIELYPEILKELGIIQNNGS